MKENSENHSPLEPFTEHRKRDLEKKNRLLLFTKVTKK
jgi:hypothetical protein